MRSLGDCRRCRCQGRVRSTLDNCVPQPVPDTLAKWGVPVVLTCVWCLRQECVEQLLRNMFDEALMENCIVNGTQVLLTLLEPRRAG